MSIITDFVRELRTVSGVTDLVDNRINPVVDRGQSIPSIVFNTRGGFREAYTRDAFGLRETFIQLDIYTETYPQLDSLRTAIIDHFNGFTGTFNSAAADGGSLISSCRMIATRELVEGQNDRVFRCVIELNILN